MARKNTARATPIKPPKMYVFEVAISDEDKIEHVEVVGTRVESDIDTLRVFQNGELTGEFREWLYYIRLDELEDEDVLVENEKPRKTSADNLPPNWGKVDGQSFE